MTVAAGTRLGPYEITAQLGAGGMGEVYRARDSRLDRTVAIKVLPRRLASDPRLRERFEREARAISALTHPHICTLYDIGTEDGTAFLVMEYLEGESLADRLEKGPLPIDQVIRYGVEIAEALEKAHRAGIVHRDLKPGNIVLTKGGAKLLDFGLAKFSQAVVSDPNAPTTAKPLTEEGTILGTFQYMAPEQVEGRDADPRTDIFALGAVLYEMATGKRAFEAKTKASLIASILDREPPPISAVQPLTPPAFERVVRMCLAKDPDERWQSAHDVAAELKWIATTSSETIGPGARRSRMKYLARGIALIAAGLLIGALAAWLALRDRAKPQPVSRYVITTPENLPIWMGGESLAITPDGSRIVYRAFENGKQAWYVRDRGSLAARRLIEARGHRSMTFSPDGKWLAFGAGNGDLMKIAIDGGTPQKVAEPTEGTLGMGWSDNWIYYIRDWTRGIWRVPANGGEPEQVAKIETAKGYRALAWPEPLPGGETVLATAWLGGSWDDAKIIAISLRDGSSKVIVNGGSAPTWSPSGHLLFGRGSNLMAIAFDSKTLETRGEALTVVGGVAADVINGTPQYALSRSGDLVYVPGGPIVDTRALLWVDRRGKETEVVPTHRHYATPVVSPDGRTIAVTIETATFDNWLLDIERDLLTRLSFGGDDADPTFTPDGRWVIYRSTRAGPNNFYRAPADGSGGEERLTTSPRNQFGAAVTPDGREMVFNEYMGGKNRDIVVMSMDTRKVRPLIATKFDETPAGFSPDGRWLMYWSDESGMRELYVRPYPAGPGKWQITTGGGESAEWTADGREIVYRTTTKFYAVPVQTSPAFRAGKPQFLFEGNYERDVQFGPDGRFLLVKDDAPATAPHMAIVLNWTEELKRRVPVP